MKRAVLFCVLFILASRTAAEQAAHATPHTPRAAAKRIGILAFDYNFESTLGPGRPRYSAFTKALAGLGYREGETAVLIPRVVTVRDSLPAVARELLAGGVDILVAGGSTEALSAMQATTTVPIVFWSAEPIAEGLVKSIERPGENATGVIPTANTFRERLEILNAIAPGPAPVGALVNSTYLPGVGVLGFITRTADSLGMHIDPVEARTLPAIDSAFATFARHGVRAVIVMNHGLFRLNASRVVARAIEYKIPLLTPYQEARDAGALVSFAPDFIFWSQRAARMVDRILRGAQARDIAVEQSVPERYVVNLRTAAAMGVTIPASVLARADSVVRR